MAQLGIADLSYLEKSGLDVRVDEVSASISYVGEAQPGTGVDELLWRIKRVSVSGSETSITWANGTPEYVHAWSQRATYNY